jgi:3-hydroxyisobutyrate dehydrogenase-like beta-hydroxyacid dehydrogenase
MPAFKQAPDRLSSLAKEWEVACELALQVSGHGRGRRSAAHGSRGEVTVWNRTPEKTKALADTGAKVASTPAQLASAVEATITMLTDAAAIDAVYNGPNGLCGDVKASCSLK